ncbi:MAG: nuclear transport factor 2 family protein [Pseudomonadota bacterium]
MGSLETQVAQLAAKDAIRELTHRYCHAVVDGDADAIVELFCGDGQFIAHTLKPRGRDELLAFYRAGVGGKTHKPFVQNHVIEFADDTHATGRCSVEIRVWQHGQAYTQAGHYHDTYRSEGGRWRFAKREYISYHNAPWRQGWDK